MSEPIPTRIAVLLRGFKIDEKLLHLYEHLRRPNRVYDVFLMIDDTHGRPENAPEGVIWFSLAACPSVGLHYTRPDLFWLCADIPLFFAKDALPGYSHFIQLDYDVHFTRSGARFLNWVVAAIAVGAAGGIDAIGLQSKVLEPPCEWPFYARAARSFETVRFYYAPFLCLSRRAVEYLQAQRQLEREAVPGPEDDVVIAEAFIPSHLVAAGFRCLDLHEIAPGSYDSENDRSSMRMGPAGWPLGAPIQVQPSIELVHPVYSVEDHLAKAVRHAERQARHEMWALRGKLQGDDYAFVAPEIRGRYVELINELTLRAA